MSDSERRPIALIGLMGAGKSAVARVLGERLGASVADLDALLEAEEGASVAELFARSGEAWFRRRETECLAGVLATGADVVACGGGVVVGERGRALLEGCRVVWLEVSPAEAARRVASAAQRRPLLEGRDPAERLAELLSARERLYASAAHARVATDGRTAEQVADAVLAALEGGAS